MRLNKFLAWHTGDSRREVESKYIQAKLVKVNNQVGNLTTQVQPKDKVEIWETQNKAWKQLEYIGENQTILFYKPIFCLTTRRDDFGRKTIYDFLPKFYHHLKPVGRLDYFSEGLIVMTTNGDLIYELTHAKFGHRKKYLVGLADPLPERALKRFRQGMQFEEGQLNPIQIELKYNPETDSLARQLEDYQFLKLEDQYYWYEFILNEGRKNQIRRMCKSFEIPVQRLIRISQGKFSLSQRVYSHRYVRI
jgi:23S rRNA pseudouridine2605 synthase